MSATGELGASGTAMVNLLGSSMLANQWIREMTINAEDYGDQDTLLVFSPVWDAVRRGGQYWLGAWTDTVFDPAKMASFMPDLGEGDGAADPDGNFHCGLRIATLKWTNLIGISRPDPKGETYVTYLYLEENPKSPLYMKYRVFQWDYEDDAGVLYEKATIVPADVLEPADIAMLGFDPLKAVEDEGWVNRLTAPGVGKDPKKVPVTLFVLQGRNGADTFVGNDPGNLRPITRSVYNDRIWKAPVQTWAWEVGAPAQRSTWLTAPPDGKLVKWKVDDSHQWRRNNGLSHIFRAYDDQGNKRLLVEEVVTHPDGTEFEVFVIDPDVTSLDNAQYGLARGGGYVLDFNGENYHGGNSVVGFGVYNGDIARNTFIRLIPPTRKRNRGVGVKTDTTRTSLLWDEGNGNSVNIDRKLEEWKHWFNNEGGMPAALDALLEASMNTAPVSPNELEDLKDLANDLGDYYKITVRKNVPVVVPGPSPRTRRKRVSKICDECGAYLPLPGHVVGCSKKPPKPNPAPPIPQGEETWDGDPEDMPPKGKGGKGGSNVTVLREQDVEEGVGFPEIVPVDNSTLALSTGFLTCEWVAPTPAHPRGRILVGFGDRNGSNDRHPILQTTLEHLAGRYNVKVGQPKMRLVEEALWRAIRRVLAGTSGHSRGQATAYAQLQHLLDTSGSEEIRWGLSYALLGIEHLERFANPILRNTLGRQLSNPASSTTKKAPAAKKAPVKRLTKKLPAAKRTA